MPRVKPNAIRKDIVLMLICLLVLKGSCLILMFFRKLIRAAYIDPDIN